MSERGGDFLLCSVSEKFANWNVDFDNADEEFCASLRSENGAGNGRHTPKTKGVIVNRDPAVSRADVCDGEELVEGRHGVERADSVVDVGLDSVELARNVARNSLVVRCGRGHRESEDICLVRAESVLKRLDRGDVVAVGWLAVGEEQDDSLAAACRFGGRLEDLERLVETLHKVRLAADCWLQIRNDVLGACFVCVGALNEAICTASSQDAGRRVELNDGEVVIEG